MNIDKQKKENMYIMVFIIKVTKRMRTSRKLPRKKIVEAID